MKTYQDYIAAGDKEKFILQVIQEYKMSNTYQNAIIAEAYYKRDNQAIINRITFLEQYGLKHSKVKFFKLRNGFLRKTIDQEIGYLLGNGVLLDKEIKNRLGNAKFDRALQQAGYYAKLAGVSYGFWNVDKLIVFSAAEYLQLLDEQTADIKLGIRFWQIDEHKPMYVELYEIDGITCYKCVEDELECTSPKKAYKTKIQQFQDDEFIIDLDNYPCIPVFPLYSDNIRRSVLDNGLKEDIDAYDFLLSDVVDGALQLDGIYWIIKNYAGNDERELLAEIVAYKATRTTNADDS